MVEKDNLHWCNYTIFLFWTITFVCFRCFGCCEFRCWRKFVCMVSPMFFGHDSSPIVVFAKHPLKTLEGKQNSSSKNFTGWCVCKMRVKLNDFPHFGVKIQKAVGNHHLVPFSGHTHISLHTIVFFLPKQRQAPQTWTFIARDSGIKNHHILSLLSFVGKKVLLFTKTTALLLVFCSPPISEEDVLSQQWVYFSTTTLWNEPDLWHFWCDHFWVETPWMVSSKKKKRDTSF